MSQYQTSLQTVRASDEQQLHTRRIDRNAKSWIVCVHGIGEHIGRATHLADFFAQHFNVLQYDLRGHGRSGGKRGYIETFDTHFKDLKDIITHLKASDPNTQYTLFGHSMGALIAAGFVQCESHQATKPERLFLASPPIGIGGFGGRIVNTLPASLFRLLSNVSISLALGSTINRGNLSHDPAVAFALRKDSLSLKRLHTRLLFGLVHASRNVFAQPLNTSCPIHCAVGTGDKIVSSRAAQRYFATHEPQAKITLIDGAYHELHNETDTYRDHYFEYLRRTLFV